jgi:DNA-binding transcriptional MocR family regulator
VGALAEHGIHLAAPDGLNLWLPVPDEREALLRLAAAGIRAAAGTAFVAGDDPRAFVRLTTGLVTPEHAGEVAAAVASAVTG